MLHVEDKQVVIDTIRQADVKTLCFAEICTSDISKVLQNPLFNPSLKYLWSTNQYVDALKLSGFAYVQVTNLSELIFRPWSEALNRIEIDKFQGNARVLRQFRQAYGDLAKLADDNIVSYALILAKQKAE